MTELFVFLSELSVLEVGFLPSFPSSFLPFQISALSGLHVIGQRAEPGLHQTQARHCRRKTVRNREAALGSVTVYHQRRRGRKKKADLQRAALRWGRRAGGERCEPTLGLLSVSVLLCSAWPEPSVRRREKMRISELMSRGNSILIHLQSFLFLQGNYKIQSVPFFFPL